MKRIFFAGVMILCLLSCSDSIRMVEISLEGSHPWEDATHRPMWHTLTWTDGRGGVSRLHLDDGTRTVRIPIQRGMSIVVCAYPLGELEPWGGVFHPLSQEGRLVLTQREGSVAKLLQTLSKTFPGPIDHLNYPLLLSFLEEKIGDDFRRVDGNRLGKDILNGNLSKRSVHSLPPLEVELMDVPEGFWVAEDRNTESFWFDSETTACTMMLPDGLHRFLNKESDLELRVLVDTEAHRFFQYIREPPVGLR